MSRSQIIGQALDELRAREVEALACEGYAFYSGEAKEFAGAGIAAISEAMDRYG